MRKKVVPRVSKIIMSLLLLIGIGSYISGFIFLFNSSYKVSDYYDEIKEYIHRDGLDIEFYDMSEILGFDKEEETINININ